MEVERFNSFMNFYRRHTRDISRQTIMMDKQMGEAELNDEFLLNSEICWMVTNNITGILARTHDPISQLPQTDDPFEIAQFLRDELMSNRLVIGMQDIGDQDHYFCLIGDNGLVLLVEYLPDTCNASEILTIDECIDMIINISSGMEPDRFYGVLGEHYFEFNSYDRLPVTVESIRRYLR